MVVVIHPVGSVYVIVAVPAFTPLTTPLEEPTVATDISLLLQVPPPPSLNVVVAPAQTVVVPEIAEGNGLTVTGFVAEHPDVAVYDIVLVPEPTPETTPVEEPIVATDVVPLLHIPPEAVSDTVIVKPTQTLSGPVMTPGKGTIVAVMGTLALRHPAMV